MFKKLLATSTIALLAAVPAIGGSLDVSPPVAPIVYAPVSDWTGGYAGVHGTVGHLSGSTFFGTGVQGGYLYDFGDYIVGGEASYEYIFSPSSNHLFSADAIFGYDAGDVMPFVTAGGSYINPANVFAVSGGAGLAVKATDNVLLTGRYRYSYFPTPGAGMHQAIFGISYQF